MAPSTPRHSQPCLASLALLACLACLGVGSMVARAQATPWADFVQPSFLQSCTKCHGENDKVKGKVNLLKLKEPADLTSDLTLVEDLIDVLELGEMPPEKEPPLAPEVRTRLVSELRALLTEAVAANKPYPPTPIRRMNRFQYNNAVQDLFELDAIVFTLPERMLRAHSNYFHPASGKMPPNLKVGSRPLGKSQMIEPRLAGVAAFPQDLRAEHGFDNRADHLTLSPLLLESFLKLSRSIVESPDFHSKSCGIWDRFFAEPPEGVDLESVVRDRLRPFLTRAFRRPVEEALLSRHVAHVLSCLASGQSFTGSMKEAASAALASPRFFYLYQRAAPRGNSEPIDDFELASRLSLFLWGSLPDQPLLDLAARGELRKPETLAREIDRMLNHPRLKRFCESFPSQWLQLERIITSIPDRDQFPKFYHAKYHGSMHMMLEPLLLFETILVEDRSILELIDSDYSYRSPYLVSWYKTGGKSARSFQVTQVPFKRVNLESRAQGGVMTTAAIMTMTSSPIRTQPITRGAWVAGVIFNEPPEPPPADVPPLPEAGTSDVANLTLRERIAAHRTRPDCAGCHVRIDPLGFALENYGPAGFLRDHYRDGQPIDSTGLLFGKHAFHDLASFKDAILAEKDRFARGLAAHLLSFALGREVSPADAPALDRIVKVTAAHNYRMRTLIREIARSEPFLHKSNPLEPSEEAQAHPTSTQ